MDRKTVRLDRESLRDLTKALVEYRNGLDYSDAASVNMAISGLAQVIGFHQGFETDVTVPVEEEVEVAVRLRPFPNYGDLMTLEDFIAAAKSGSLIDDDGIGQYATLSSISNKEVFPSDVRCGLVDRTWTHVMWFLDLVSP